MLSDDPTLDGLRLMERDLGLALRSGAPTSEARFRLGDDVVLFRFIGSGTREPFTRALAHLAVGEPAGNGEAPSLTVDVWNSVSTGVRPSPLLQLVLDTSGPGSLSPRYELPAMTNAEVHTMVLPWDGHLAMYDVAASRALVWIDDPDRLPIWDHGAPFRTVLNWWLAGRDRYCVHAGAVGTDDGAVLLTGKGGSGKSTSALACVGSELGYLSDDYCVLAPDVHDGRPEVLSLYNTGKLNGQDDLDRLPRFAPWIVNPEALGEQKQLLFLHEHLPEAIVRRAPLRAVVLPRVTRGEAPTLTRISGGVALRALAPTSLFQLPGAGSMSLARMADLVRTVPCYRMETGSRVEAIPPALADLLGRLNSGEPAPETVGVAS